MSRSFLAVAVLAGAALSSASVPAAAGAFPGENGKIVYIAGDDVYTVDPDGSDVSNLTSTPGLNAENVAASPDGRRIAFNVTGQSVLDDAGLYVMNMNGTGVHDVLAGRNDDFIAVGAPTWSPDGTRIAFEAYAYPAFTNELFVIDADGSGLRPLTNCDCVSSSYPVWSPVASEIAFVPCCSQVITTIDVDTGATVEVFAAEAGYVNDLTWSPDGTEIAYDDLIEVYRVSIPGGTPVALTASGPGYYSNPSWSPDGTKILVESNHGSQQSNNQDVYAIDAVQGVDGGVTRVTTSLGPEYQPEWAPLCEAQCTPTALSLRITKTKNAVRATGMILPTVEGDVRVTLSRRTPSGFRRLGSKAVPLGTGGLFRASFKRPSSGKCRMEARYAGDAEREPSSATRSFAC